MKKILLSCLLGMLFLLSAAAMAETEPGIGEALRNAGIDRPVQLVQWGKTAVCFAEMDNAKCLIVLERHADAWQIVINNPTALIQDADWPMLSPDSDNAIFWTYMLRDGEFMRFHSVRDEKGLWGPVDRYFGSTGADGITDIQITSWDEAHGGEIFFSISKADENDNLLGGELLQVFPADWMSGFICLKDFDVSRFPPIARDPYYYWEGDRFVQDAAAALMPDYTCLKGLIKDGALHFLMQKPDGTRVYVIAEYLSSHEVRLIESSPLPQDTYLGVENFTDSLWIHGRCVTIHLLYDYGRAGIEYIYTARAVSEAGAGFLFFGDRTVWDGSQGWPQTILYGDHPWDDITEIDWDSLPYTLEEASVQMDSSRYAMVVNPVSTDRLNLRENNDKASRSKGKYYTGTPVTAGARGSDWTLVSLGDWNCWRQGYMMNRYLTYGRTGSALRLDISPMPMYDLAKPYLFVYKEPDKNSRRSIRLSSVFGEMLIIGVVGDDWFHVWFPAAGEYGFVRQIDLSPGNG